VRLSRFHSTLATAALGNIRQRTSWEIQVQGSTFWNQNTSDSHTCCQQTEKRRFQATSYSLSSSSFYSYVENNCHCRRKLLYHGFGFPFWEFPISDLNVSVPLPFPLPQHHCQAGKHQLAQTSCTLKSALHALYRASHKGLLAYFTKPVTLPPKLLRISYSSTFRLHRVKQTFPTLNWVV